MLPFLLLIMIDYPSDQLIYWKNIYSPLLHRAVLAYFNSANLNEQELESIKSYVKHWIEFEGRQFEDESDRQKLLRDLEQCDSQNFEDVIDSLLDWGVDPF
jgi:hypothetical protein